jgi:N-dimethylarginine dimethylaminohydrolase
MCPPEFYGIQYEINPWMNRKRQADHELAARQWQQLYQVLESVGVRISLISPVRGLPDLVFTANAGLVFQQRAILSRFRHQQRQGEEQHYRQWFAQAGFAVEVLPKPFCFEGAGDALFCGDNLFGGYRIRSDILSLQYVGSRLGCRVFPLELMDPYFYHLDTCFCPLNEETVLYYPGAFAPGSRSAIQSRFPDAITVSLSAPVALETTVNYTTANGTATAGSDYPSVFWWVVLPAYLLWGLGLAVLVVAYWHDTGRHPDNSNSPVDGPVAQLRAETCQPKLQRAGRPRQRWLSADPRIEGR